jgi:Tfp pilus assembly protein PilO
VNPQTNRLQWQFVAVAVGVCLGLSVAAYALGVQPLLERREAETRRRSDLQERRQTASQLSASLADVQHQLATAKQALAKTSLRLQPAVLVNQRLEAIARLATECGVALDEMHPGVPADSTHYQTVPLRVVGSGRYPACTAFLRKLRGTFGDMGIRSFQASSSGTSPAEPTALFQAELVWYTELPRK